MHSQSSPHRHRHASQGVSTCKLSCVGHAKPGMYPAVTPHHALQKVSFQFRERPLYIVHTPDEQYIVRLLQYAVVCIQMDFNRAPARDRVPLAEVIVQPVQPEKIVRQKVPGEHLPAYPYAARLSYHNRTVAFRTVPGKCKFSASGEVSGLFKSSLAAPGAFVARMTCSASIERFPPRVESCTTMRQPPSTRSSRWASAPASSLPPFDLM